MPQVEKDQNRATEINVLQVEKDQNPTIEINVPQVEKDQNRATEINVQHLEKDQNLTAENAQNTILSLKSVENKTVTYSAIRKSTEPNRKTLGLNIRDQTIRRTTIKVTSVNDSEPSLNQTNDINGLTSNLDRNEYYESDAKSSGSPTPRNSNLKESTERLKVDVNQDITRLRSRSRVDNVSGPLVLDYPRKRANTIDLMNGPDRGRPSTNNTEKDFSTTSRKDNGMLFSRAAEEEKSKWIRKFFML